MGSPSPIFRHAWRRHNGRLLARRKLHNRLLRLLLQQRHRSQHLHPQYIRCRFRKFSFHPHHPYQPLTLLILIYTAALRQANVRKTRRSMGYITPRLYMCCFRACADSVLYLWGADTGEESLCAYGVSALF